MKKVTFFVIALLCYVSMSFGQVNEGKRNAANKLWGDYGRKASNPSQMPAAVPLSAANVDNKTIAPNFTALENALKDMVNKNGGIIRFNNTSPKTINFSRYIELNLPFPTRDKDRTIVVQAKNITFNGTNQSSIFVIRGKLRLVIQDATFTNCNLKGVSMANLRSKFRTGGGAIEVAQAGPYSASLRVRNCQFINNTVSHFKGIGENQNGAAIRFNNLSTGEVFGCTFKNNRAVTGGAIGGTSINRLTIVNSMFDGNLSNGYESTTGYMNVVEGAGALRVDRTKEPLEIYGSTFENNSANVKVSVIEVYIRPIPEGSQNYPKNGPALIIDNCVFRKNRYNNYAGVSNFKRVFFAGCIVFHSGGVNGSFRGGTMKMTNTTFDQNEVGQANVRMINNFEFDNCTFANTKFLGGSFSALQQGAVFLQAVHNSGKFNNCTFYKNEPLNGAAASDIMFWGGDIPGKVSLNNTIFYRTNKNTSIKQVRVPLKGGNNNQHIPGVAGGALSKVANGNSNTSNPNITPNNITNMCLGTNSLAKGFGGLPDCGSSNSGGGNNGGGNNGGGSSNQVIANGTYFLVSVSNGQNMIDKRSENNVRMTGANAAFPAQKWIVKHLGNNVYTLKNQGSGRYLEVPFAKCSNGANVNTWTNANDNHKKWQIIKHNNQYELKPMHCLGKSLDRDFGDRTKNGNVHLYDDVNNPNQRWKLTTVAGTRTTASQILIEQEQLVAYPNPLQQQVKLQGVQAGDEVVIRDQLGQEVYRVTIQNSNEALPINHLHKGVYFLLVQGKTLRLVKK